MIGTFPCQDISETDKDVTGYANLLESNVK